MLQNVGAELAHELAVLVIDLDLMGWRPDKNMIRSKSRIHLQYVPSLQGKHIVRWSFPCVKSKYEL